MWTAAAASRRIDGPPDAAKRANATWHAGCEASFMTMRPMPRFLPGDCAPSTTAYHELDPRSGTVVRRLLVPAGDRFPDPKAEGGFYTASSVDLGEWRARRSSRPA